MYKPKKKSLNCSICLTELWKRQNKELLFIAMLSICQFSFKKIGKISLKSTLWFLVKNLFACSFFEELRVFFYFQVSKIVLHIQNKVYNFKSSWFFKLYAGFSHKTLDWGEKGIKMWTLRVLLTILQISAPYLKRFQRYCLKTV